MRTRIFEALSAAVFLETWVLAALTIPTLPAQVPTKFGFDGSVHAMGSPALLWLMPLMATVAYAIAISTQFMPARWRNYPVKITDQNREAVFALGREMQPAIKLSLMVTFLATEWGSLDSAIHGVQSSFDTAALFAPIALLIAVLIYYTIKMRAA